MSVCVCTGTAALTVHLAMTGTNSLPLWKLKHSRVGEGEGGGGEVGGLQISMKYLESLSSMHEGN